MVPRVEISGMVAHPTVLWVAKKTPQVAVNIVLILSLNPEFGMQV